MAEASWEAIAGHIDALINLFIHADGDGEPLRGPAPANSSPGKYTDSEAED